MKIKTKIKLAFGSLMTGCAILVYTFMLFPNPIHPIALPLVIVAIILIGISIPIMIKYEDYNEGEGK